MRSLITGASGFVGQHLIQCLLRQGDDVHGCYLPGTAVPEVLFSTTRHSELSTPASTQDVAGRTAPRAGQSASGSLTWHSLDISNLRDCQELVSKVQPQVIYHLAGISFVPQAEDDFMGALAANVAGVDNIARVSHQLNSGIRIVIAGSADVYGKVRPEDLPVREETPTCPVNAYSTTKLMAELVADRWHRLGQVSVVVLRPFNHIGPGQDFRFVAPGFSRQLVMISRGLQEPRIQVGNLSARKDFTDVRDVVEAYRRAAIAPLGKGALEKYVICSGRSVPVQAILDGLIAVSGLQVEVTTDPARMRPAEVPELYGSFAKAERELEWRPSITLEQSLSDIYRDVSERIAIAQPTSSDAT